VSVPPPPSADAPGRDDAAGRDAPGIVWHDWSAELLRVARDEQRPVLLVITAEWSRFCGELEREVLSDPAVVAAVSEHALAVRVDRAQRPDVDARYGQGGWPSTVVLDADGAVLAAGTFVEADTLIGWISQAARRQRTQGPDFRAVSPVPRGPTGRLDDSILPAIDAALLSHFDARHGGFGQGPKFPHPEALDYAILRLADDRRPELRELVEKTLLHMAEGGLHDAEEGGFFRFCSLRDWRAPHTDKLLEVNAGLLRNYLEAGQLLGRQDLIDVGARTAEALLAQFHDPASGLFFAALQADDEYYAAPLASRRTRRAPPADSRLHADANARAISALLKAGAVLARPELTAAAVSAAAALVARLWRPGQGMFHGSDGAGRRQPGLLRDQAETARALLHVLQYTDDRRFEPVLADLLARLASVHVAASGELVDRAGAGARPDATRPDAALAESAVAAEALLRGALISGHAEYAAVARRALGLAAHDFRRHGYAMAAYGRAVELVLCPPLHVIVVGPRDGATTLRLCRAASAGYLPSRVVQRLDPVEDREALQRLGLPLRGRPVAYVFLGRDGAAEHDDPDTLWAVLAAANARRRQRR